MEIPFTPQEHSLLVMILNERHRELLLEISRATSRDFRRQLQEREALLESLLRKLAPEAQEKAA